MKRTVSRRSLLKAAVSAGAAAVAAPYVLTSSALGASGATPASDRIVMGGIGLGGQGWSDLRGFMGHREVQVVAVCDVKNADLKKVRVITKDSYYGQVMHFNLEKYSETGAIGRYMMRKEDAFIVPEKGRGFLGLNLGTAATIIGTLSSAALIYDYLKQ